MFEPQVQIEIYTLHKRVANRSKEKEFSFVNLQEVSSQLLITNIYDEFTMANVLI